MAAETELVCGKYRLPIGERTLVMGIINVTPDSFSGDGLAGQTAAAVRHGVAMVEEGADIIDVGGESTRPGAEPVPLEEELRRVVPVVRELAAAVDVPISVDTYKAAVAREALAAGATMVNDISGMRFDPGMAEVVAKSGAGVVLMHILGTPRDMQVDPHYDDVMMEIGVERERIVVDPGIGFGKTREHNLEIIRRLGELRSLGMPILLGVSRKSFIGATLDLPPEERLEGTAAAVAIGIANGADIVRVHDVGPMIRVARMTDAIVRG
jgi:dihydropteroate synthase